jgi:transposase-like protein
MGNLWPKVQASFRCVLRVARLGKSCGVEALDRRLAEWEEAVRAYPVKSRCAHCDSTDLEPTVTVPAPDGAQVVRFRCKACGRESGV